MSPPVAKRFIRECLDSGELIIIQHAKSAMADDDMIAQVVINILCGGWCSNPNGRTTNGDIK